MKRGLPAVREQVAKLEHENAKLKRVLDSIAHYVAENWTIAWGHPGLHRILEDAGYDVGAPGEPEPFIHGDSAEGAEG